jgi:hypothetical protein
MRLIGWHKSKRLLILELNTGSLTCEGCLIQELGDIQDEIYSTRRAAYQREIALSLTAKEQMLLRFSSCQVTQRITYLCAGDFAKDQENGPSQSVRTFYKLTWALCEMSLTIISSDICRQLVQALNNKTFSILFESIAIHGCPSLSHQIEPKL